MGPLGGPLHRPRLRRLVNARAWRAGGGTTTRRPIQAAGPARAPIGLRSKDDHGQRRSDGAAPCVYSCGSFMRYPDPRASLWRNALWCRGVQQLAHRGAGPSCRRSRLVWEWHRASISRLASAWFRRMSRPTATYRQLAHQGLRRVAVLDAGLARAAENASGSQQCAWSRCVWLGRRRRRSCAK